MKKYLILALMVFVIGSLTIAVLAIGPHGPAGKSDTAHLYLYEKDPTTWDIVEGGAWGKMTYNLSGSTFNFVFNGHGLEVGWHYQLIYYPDPWPGSGLICLGGDIADENGDVHIMGPFDTGSLPAEYDDNYPDGAKIWLVLSCDVSCGDPPGREMVGWKPTEYLFENELITFTEE